MERIEFIEFSKKKQEEVTKLIEQLSIKLSSIESTQDIDLNNYGSIEDIKRKYKKHNKTNLIKRIFGPTTEDLKEYILQTERSKIIAQIDKSKTELKTIISVRKSMLENRFVNSSYLNVKNHNIIIKLILEYCLKEDVEFPEIIDILLSLYKTSNKTNNVESQLENTISSFFDKRNYPKKNVDCKDILFSFKKILILAMGEEEYNKYIVVINGLLNEIKIRYQKINSQTGEREILLEEQQAIIELQQYISGTEVIKGYHNINEFKRLMQKAHLSPAIISAYSKKMATKIEEERIKKQQEEDRKLLKKYLNPEYLEIYYDAIRELQTLENGELDNLLERTAKDVVSLCRYINLIDQNTNEYVDVQERISEKINLLHSEIKKVTEKTTRKARFNYLVNKDGYPTILRKIECLDSFTYFTIYSLLNSLALDDKQGELVESYEDVNVYEISSNNLILSFAKKGDTIVIIDIYTKSLANQTKLTKQDYENIKRIFSSSKTQDEIVFQRICEEVILQSLNLHSLDQQYRLHKKKN